MFDTTGHPSGLSTAVESVRKGGQVVLVGQTGETAMEYSPLVRSETDLQCSYASEYEAFEAFLAGETCKPVFDVAELRE